MLTNESGAAVKQKDVEMCSGTLHSVVLIIVKGKLPTRVSIGSLVIFIYFLSGVIRYCLRSCLFVKFHLFVFGLVFVVDYF